MPSNAPLDPSEVARMHDKAWPDWRFGAMTDASRRKTVAFANAIASHAVDAARTEIAREALDRFASRGMPKGTPVMLMGGAVMDFRDREYPLPVPPRKSVFVPTKPDGSIFITPEIARAIVALSDDRRDEP